MSLVAILAFAAISAGQPAAPPLTETAEDRTPMRCRPAPYYVAEQAAGRTRPQRLTVTGSRVPLVARDYGQRRSRPCFLMRDDEAPPNPFRSAARPPGDPKQASGGAPPATSLWPTWAGDFGLSMPRRTAD